MKTKKSIFLLGGYDLEMIEIKNIFDNHEIKYIDKNLSWGAKLSYYEDELKKYEDYTIYGIELNLDIEVPKNYIEIDHHNHNSHKLSSIEQVAKILDIKLNRYQQLVAANDSGYIKGMEKLCATNKEIEDIRKKDREAQGVTQKEENLAIKSLNNNTQNVIYSLTSYFSTICDRVYNKYKEYIVYNDNKIVFYGYKLNNILEFLDKNNIKNSDYYFGGGEFGFVGIKENIFNKNSIENLIEEFTKKIKGDL